MLLTKEKYKNKTRKQKQHKKNITFSVDVYKVTRDINCLQNITIKNKLLICNLLLHFGMAQWPRLLEHYKPLKSCCYCIAFTKTKELINNGKIIVWEWKVPEISGCRFGVRRWVSFVTQFLHGNNRTSLSYDKSFVRIPRSQKPWGTLCSWYSAAMVCCNKTDHHYFSYSFLYCWIPLHLRQQNLDFYQNHFLQTEKRHKQQER